MQKGHKKLTPSEVRKKIYHYCAYQERSHQEVKSKLFDLGLYAQEVDELISHLITEGYLNEERFARAFTGGKFRIKNWGRIRIVQALEAKGLTKNCISAGLTEITDGDYNETIKTLIEKKSDQLTESNLFVKRDKVAKYVIQKGFEPELVWNFLKEKIKDR